jgi:hypothetical protein
MKCDLKCPVVRWVAVGMVVLAYFVVFPDDAVALLAPIASLAEAVAAPLATLLDLTCHVSPWLYGLAAVAMIAWAVVRVWGGRVSRPAERG